MLLGMAICIASVVTMLSGCEQGDKPIRVGLSIAQTGPLSGAGKSGLVALEMWRDDVNAAGGLLGRQVELVVYDDQTNPAMSPGLYTKLLDVDKVDLLIGPYGTNVTAPIMPLVKRRNRLLIGNFPLDINANIGHDKYFNNMPVAGGGDWAAPFLELAEKLEARKIGILAADAEFAQTLATGLRSKVAEHGMEVVYDQNYPPNTVEFSSIMRAIRAQAPEAIFVASYPSDSAAIVRALGEIGVGDSVRLLGGGMVGLQYAALLESLGSMLNGVVNYTFWAPEESMNFPGMKDFLERYQARAADAGVDPLGYYLPPYDYAIGQILAQAVSETNSLDQAKLADYIRSHEMQTIVGNIRYNEKGEWSEPRVIYVQFRDVANNNIDQFRQPGRQVIVAPAQYKSSDVVPFAQAR